jgi:hypothetical protein
MPHNVVVLIREDPSKTHRPAEGLRIALGLSTGPNPLKIILIGRACLLLTEEACDLVDGEILEKHLPVIQELELPIIVPEGSEEEYSFDQGFSIMQSSLREISSLLAGADRVLVF